MNLLFLPKERLIGHHALLLHVPTYRSVEAIATGTVLLKGTKRLEGLQFNVSSSLTISQVAPQCL